MRRLPALVALCSVLVVILFVQIPAAAQSLPQVLVTGVAPNQSSARIFYNPVTGAKDYRAYDVANPTDVKYAGMAHYTPGDNCPGDYCLHGFVTNADGSLKFPYQTQDFGSVQRGPTTVQDVPANDIEWNGLLDGAQHTLVVQAVDAIGPAPQHNLYPFPCCDPSNALWPPAGMLGSNKGPTADGNTSTNGQGPYTNAPKVIAQSQPFVVSADQAYTPLGKIAGASQQFLDTFDQSEAGSVQKVSQDACGGDAFNNHGHSLWTIGNKWNLLIKSADFTDTMPFISNAHFMDMLFDGGDNKAGCGPGDTTYSSLSMSPQKPLDMTAGGIVHLTMEVDAHQSFRRWLAFNLSPANDQIQGFGSGGGPVNNGNNALFFETKAAGSTLSIFNNSTTPVTATCGQPVLPETHMTNGRGLDDRSKLDFFVSKTHYAFFQDDSLVCQGDLAAPIAWFNQPLSTYFTHYLYHSDADIADMRQFVLSGGTFAYPLNSYWFNDPQAGTAASADSAGIAYPPGYGFPHSDERHWDNMGFEAVPATSDFASFMPAVAIAPAQAPQFTSGPQPTVVASTMTPVPTGTTQPTNTPQPTATAAATSTPAPPTPTSGPVQTGTWQNVTPGNADLNNDLGCGSFGAASVVNDPDNRTDFYARFDCQGTWRSTDSGQTWQGPIDASVGNGTAANCAGGFSVAGNGAGHAPTLYQGCIRGSLGFWRSDDGGVHWTSSTIAPAGNRQDVYPPVVDPHDKQHLLIPAHELNAIYQSTDGGQTWSNVTLDPGMNASGTNMVFFIDTGNAASTRGTWLWTAQGTGGAVGTWRTSDGGAHWTHVESLEHEHGGMQIYQPDANGTVFIAGVYSQLGWGVLRSTDYGQTWAHVGVATNENIVYGTPNNVYADRGIGTASTWELAPQPGTGTWAQPTPAMPVAGIVAAVGFDGSHYVVVTTNATAGLWRYVEPGTNPQATSTPAPTSTPQPTATTVATSTPVPASTPTVAPTPGNQVMLDTGDSVAVHCSGSQVVIQNISPTDRMLTCR